jgi:(5-formylfuran-3-yl)methyl phosphate synthase
VAKLLVSVRSKVEALAALAGGATIIDVKEPLNGPLGRASFDVWREVKAVVPRSIPLSVALGELNDWSHVDEPSFYAEARNGLAFCKLGLADAPTDWVDRWSRVRREFSADEMAAPAWVAVVYIDWQTAQAPHPESIIEAASTIDECQGVLFDTWDKSRSSPLDLTWKPRIDRVRDSGRFVALAGSLDTEAIGRLAPLSPDIFAVRGAACTGADRRASVDSQRVSILARLAANVPSLRSCRPESQ